MSFNSCGTCPTCLRAHGTYCHDFFGRNFAAARADGFERSLARRRARPRPLLRPVELRDACGRDLSQRRQAARVGAVRRRGTFWLRHPDGRRRSAQLTAATVRKLTRRLRHRCRRALGDHGRRRSSAARPIIGVDVKPSGSRSPARLGATHTIDASSQRRTRRDREAHGYRGRLQRRDERRHRRCSARRSTASHRWACAASSVRHRVGRRCRSTSTCSSRSAGRFAGIVEGDSIPELFLPQLFELWRAGTLPGRPADGGVRLRQDQRGSPRGRVRRRDQARAADGELRCALR